MDAELTVELVCDKCRVRALTDANGWLILSSQCIGYSTAIDHFFCSECKDAVLLALGFKDRKNYASVVKAYGELTRRLPSSQVTEDVPFYLLDDDLE